VTRESEVGEEGAVAALRVAGEKDVGRLDVAVDQPVAMCLVERARDLLDDRGRPAGRQRALAVDQPAQVGPVDKTHDHEQAPSLLPRLVDGHDRRVVQAPRGAPLVLEALAELLILGELGRDDLQGDAARERELVGAVDDPHPAATDDRFHAAAAEDGPFRQGAH
jgi:hypothetical protein